MTDQDRPTLIFEAPDALPVITDAFAVLLAELIRRAAARDAARNNEAVA